MSGFVAAALAFLAVYHWGTAADRAILAEPTPELSWLKKEFRLSDAEYDRIVQLHLAYEPECGKMCARIAAANAELKELLSRTNVITGEIRGKLEETSRLRAECQGKMLGHFYNVSQAMPPEQGKRYLAWVQERTLVSSAAMEEHHSHE